MNRSPISTAFNGTGVGMPNCYKRIMTIPRIMIVSDPEDCEEGSDGSFQAREYTEDDGVVEDVIKNDINIGADITNSVNYCQQNDAGGNNRFSPLPSTVVNGSDIDTKSNFTESVAAVVVANVTKAATAVVGGSTRMYSCKDNNGTGFTMTEKSRKSDYSVDFRTDCYMEKFEDDLESDKNHHSSDQTCNFIILAIVYFIVIITFPFSMVVCIKIAQEYERAVIFRLGRLSHNGAKGPGIFFVLPCIETYHKVDLRTISFNVPPQEILTRDSVTVTVDAVVYYRVCNAVVSVANVEDAHHSTRLLAQSTLRNVLGTKTLSEVLMDREGIGNLMQEQLKSATYPWGIQLERVEIKDCRLPKMLQRSMAAEAEAAREARAKEIASVGERDASIALKEASKLLSESATAIQLRYLQTLINVSNEKTSTIIFPLPICLMEKLLERSKEEVAVSTTTTNTTTTTTTTTSPTTTTTKEDENSCNSNCKNNETIEGAETKQLIDNNLSTIPI